MVTKVKAIAFEDDERGLSVSESDLKTLAHLCAIQVGLESRANELQLELADINAKLRTVSEQDIPALMEELGVGTFKLFDGTGVEIDIGVAANISEANRPKAFRWLDKHKHGDLIKNVFKVSFNREDREKADKFKVWAIKKKLNVGNKQSVHAGTLKAFVKEELRKEAEGEVKKKDYLPRDLFGVFEYKKTRIVMP